MAPDSKGPFHALSRSVNYRLKTGRQAKANRHAAEPYGSATRVEELKRTGELETEAVNIGCLGRDIRSRPVQVPPSRPATWPP